MEFRFQNVNDAYTRLVAGIASSNIPTTKLPSRNGDVLQVMEPVTCFYERPWERVLFNAARDANPFFHLYEALWMLAGRNDVAPLDYYLGGKYSAFSDDGKTANGAYGHRWRMAEVPNLKNPHEDSPRIIDQLSVLLAHLKRESNPRRAVLVMWNVQDDLLRIDDQYENYSKDVCCNLEVIFSIRDVPIGTDSGGAVYGHTALDMTVVNRSNDLIWGMLGANYVHFTFLLEYMANCLGYEVGQYRHFTNNLHVYVDRWEFRDSVTAMKPSSGTMWDKPLDYPKDNEQPWQIVPLVTDRLIFDREVQQFVSFHEKNKNYAVIRDTWRERFLQVVAKPMCHAFHMHKQRDYTAALQWVDQILMRDWRLVAKQWIEKRYQNWKRKQNVRSDQNVQSGGSGI